MSNSYYYSLNDYYRNLWGEKAYKISLSGGMSCPNRDGSISDRGCIFCSEKGSGDFAINPSNSVADMITNAINLISDKYKGNRYIAYFQAFTNTYAPVSYLEKLFTDTINDTRISALSIATRPDCLPDDIIALLKKLNMIKPVTIELGLQTSNEATAKYINRGYPLSVYDDACIRLTEAQIPFVVHMIVGLKGETTTDYLNTARHIIKSKASGIKIQLLHILKNTALALEYEQGLFEAMTIEEYVKAVVDIIEILPKDMVVHRVTGDGPKSLLIAPMWSTNKKNVLNSITREFIKRKTYQGKEYKQWL